MSLTKEQVLAFIGERPRLGRIATASPDGHPHVVPVWFELDGERLLVHSSGESRKVRNVRANGRFAMTIDVDAWPYKGVTVSGRAEAVGADVVDPIPLVRRLAVVYLGEPGEAMGEYIASMAGEHVTLILHVEETEAWDYS